MAPQAPKSAKALLARLQPFLDTSAMAKVEAATGKAGWPSGANPRDVPVDDTDPPFGGQMEDVSGLVVHNTGGWPARAKAQGFVDRYIKAGTTDRGIGPQFYISHDGSVFQILSAGRVAWHARPRNARTIGVETGNLGDVASPPGNGWKEARVEIKDAKDPKATGEPKPAPGPKTPQAKLFGVLSSGEYILAEWTTSKEWQPPDGHMEASQMMLFSEEQYRSWALLARFLCEAWEIPRAFPFAPHTRRDTMVSPQRWKRFRILVKAEPTAKVVAGLLANGLVAPASIAHVKTGHLLASPAELDDDEVLPTQFAAAIGKNGLAYKGRDVVVNDMWTRMIQAYRGIHGHAFSGDAKGGDHNCPGALFDWHRFARDVWDWWWFPFDAGSILVVTWAALLAQLRREYGPRSATLREYYFDSLGPQYYILTEEGYFPVAVEVAPVTAGAGVPPEVDATYWAHFHGGMHFRLAEKTPVYAACAGQLVAARFPKRGADQAVDASADVDLGSSSFVLLRHEVYHQLGDAPRIDYDKEPSVVYSLYMHLSPSDAMTYAEESAKNPDWLNRALARKRLCEAGLAFHKAHPDPADAWKRRAGVSPTTLPEAWDRDRVALSRALETLAAGGVAVFPEGEGCVRVSLGDFLGNAGVVSPRVVGQELAAAGFGIHFEVFSKDLVSPDFTLLDASSVGAFYGVKAAERCTNFLEKELGSAKALRDLVPVERARRFERVALKSKSEWGLSAADFPAGGFPVAERFLFWADVAKALAADPATPKEAQLPADGVVHHYHPLGFLDWINARTWKSEWPKYRVHEVDAAGNETTTLAPAPDRPPGRRATDLHAAAPAKPKKKPAPAKTAPAKPAPAKPVKG